MRHRVKTKTLHRDKDHRKSLLRTLSTQLVEHEKITTTLAKAKYLRPHVEKLITRAKKGNNFNNVKYMRARLSSEDAIRKILEDLGPRFKSRAGGYTRIVKVGERDGDKASMARIELVDKPKKAVKKTVKKAKKKVEPEKKEKKVVEKAEKVERPTKKKKLTQKRVLKKKVDPKQREQRQKRMSNV